MSNKKIPVNGWKYQFLIIVKLSMTMIQKHHLFGHSWYDSMPIYKSFLPKHVLVYCKGLLIKFILFSLLNTLNKCFRCCKFDIHGPEPNFWEDLESKVMESIRNTLDRRVQFYEDEIRKLSELRFTPVWNFCNFFILKVVSLLKIVNHEIVERMLWL